MSAEDTFGNVQDTYVQTNWDSAPLPEDFRWVSKRLTREIVDVERAKKGRYRSSYTLKMPFVEASMHREDPQTDADYAVRATEIARDRTGTLARPNRYIRMVLDFHLATFSVPFIWEGGGQQDIATLFSTQYVYDVGRVYVGLFGSTHNIVSAGQEETLGGRTPSDADGIYRILQDSRERGEAHVTQSRLTSDRKYSDEEQADLAASLLDGVTNPLPLRTYDVLAQPYVCLPNHTLRNDVGHPVQYDLVVIGTAIWAGTPTARPDPSSSGLVDPVRLQLWPVLDALNDQFAQALRKGEASSLPNEVRSDDVDVWTAFAGWFVHQGRHIGREPSRLLACIAPSRWNPRRHLGRGWKQAYDPQPTDLEGFVVQVDDQRMLITETGEVIPVRVHNDGACVYSPPDRDDRWLGPHETPMSMPFDALPAVRVAMWHRAAEWRRRAHLSGDRRFPWQP